MDETHTRTQNRFCISVPQQKRREVWVDWEDLQFHVEPISVPIQYQMLWQGWRLIDCLSRQLNNVVLYSEIARYIGIIPDEKKPMVEGNHEKLNGDGVKPTS